VVRVWYQAGHSLCDQRLRTPFSYNYPIKPFTQQHPIRGFFGDPRTLVSEGEFGITSPRTPGSFTFHNGIDISAATGTPVYPVATGTARIGYVDEVIVDTPDLRTFQYFHIKPAVRPGQHVRAYHTVLGYVLHGFLHVHLTEIDGFRVHNPLDPGHLTPFHDHTVPAVQTTYFSDQNGRPLDPGNLHGSVLIAAAAFDLPPLPVPVPWAGFPVTPALLTWRLQRSNGTPVLPETAVADFRKTEPANRYFWDVYAAGTYQNFPVFGHTHFVGEAGRYLFNLTPQALNTKKLPNGQYQLRIKAADVCGNSSTLTQPIRLHN
jgi:murein DD-endopeptidase MepM/ murein hydrolase activator NlpD